MEPWEIDRNFANAFRGDIRYWAWQWMYSQPVSQPQEPPKEEVKQEEPEEEWRTSVYLLPKPKS